MDTSEYPVSLDLAIKPMEATPAPTTTKSKNAKPYYPSLYLNNIDGLDALPREGYALIRFKRRSTTKSENDEGTNHSVDLEIQELRLPEKSSEEEQGDMEDAMKGLAKERGLNIGESDEEEAEEPAEEEAAETPADEAAEGMDVNETEEDEED